MAPLTTDPFPLKKVKVGKFRAANSHHVSILGTTFIIPQYLYLTKVAPATHVWVRIIAMGCKKMADPRVVLSMSSQGEDNHDITPTGRAQLIDIWRAVRYRRKRAEDAGRAWADGLTWEEPEKPPAY